MSENRRPPEWPSKTTDWERLGDLATWLEDELVDANDVWKASNPDPFDDGYLMTQMEKALLVKALDSNVERWVAVARHLRSGSASRKLVNLMGHLLEQNAFAPNSDLSERPRIGIFEDSRLIEMILRKKYEKEVERAGKEKFDKIKSVLTAILRGEKVSETDEKTGEERPFTDKERHKHNMASVAEHRKKGLSDTYLLGVLIQHIRHARTSD